MRIIFMGSPDFAVPSLEALVAAGHEVVAAYAQPPRPAGRGKAERKTAVHLAAQALGILVRTPKSLRSEEELKAGLDDVLKEHSADDGLWLFAYGSLMWKPEIEVAERRVATVRGWHRRFCLWQWRFRARRSLSPVDAGRPRRPASTANPARPDRLELRASERVGAPAFSPALHLYRRLDAGSL